MARPAFSWLCAENSSSSSRLSPHFSAIISAEIPCGTMLKRSWSFGESGPSPGPTALEPIGTRVMCSIPPAITTSYWPAITPIAAKLAACWPEPHIRSRVVPHTSTGRPAISAAFRAMLNPCSPT